MPYKDFMIREDVYKVIEKTLQYYYEENVKKNDLNTTKKTDSMQTFYCYSRLNAIIPRITSNRVMEYIYRDNRITSSIFRKIMMKMYISSVFHMPRLMSEKTITLPLLPRFSKEVMVYPGNKKIKIFDFDKMTIDNILKDGFSRVWFAKEIIMREKPKWNFVLPLEKIGENSYREKLLIGHPFPRLKRKEKIFFTPVVKEYMEKIKGSGQVQSLDEYCKQLEENINQSIEKINNKIKEEAKDNILKYCKHLSMLLKSSKGKVNLVFSHGDFQAGNLFLEEETKKMWLLDWETWGTRSQHYDEYNFYYGMRNTNRLIGNIRQIMFTRGARVGYIDETAVRTRDKLIVYLLEDALWQIEETAILPNKAVSNGLRKYINKKTQSIIIKILKKSCG